MDRKKELVEKLDMYEVSKNLFISNLKLLRKERDKYSKQVERNMKKNHEGISEYELFNYRCIKAVYCYLEELIQKAEDILEFGVKKESLEDFYLSLVKLYEGEGSDEFE